MRREERGQVMIIAALAMVAMLAMSALVLDGGYIYLQRCRMQNAADSAALAGARELALGGDVQARVNEYAIQRNGADYVQTTIQGSTVTVVAAKEFPTFFAGLIGIPEVTVRAEAKASYSGARSMRGLRPIAVKEETYEPGTEYTIWHSEPIVDGQRGWLDFEGGGASELTEWVRNGYDGEVDIGEEIAGEPGVIASAIHEAGALIGKTVVVCAYDQMLENQGKWYYHISSFLAFEITDVKSTGDPKWIKGRFQHLVTVGGWGGPDHGVRVVKLTE